MNKVVKFTQVSASDDKKIKSIPINFLYMHISKEFRVFSCVV